MRFSSLSVAMLALLSASPALAQGMDAPWSGYYAGLNAGYGFADTNTVTTGQTAVNNATVADGARPALVKMDPNGFIGGGQFGRNWQDGSVVFGFETDIQYSDMRQTRTVVTTGTAFPGMRNNQFRQELDYLGTVRGRLGHDWGGSMLYATGGVAYGGVKNAVSFTGPSPASTQQFVGSVDNTKFGWTAGAGFEHAMGPDWSIKTEYLYYDLGRNNVAGNVIPGTGGAGTGYDTRFNNMGHVIRVGVNFKMGG